MNITKVLITAAIASIATVVTLKIGYGFSGSRSLIAPIVLAGLAVVSDKLGYGSIREYFKR